MLKTLIDASSIAAKWKLIKKCKLSCDSHMPHNLFDFISSQYHPVPVPRRPFLLINFYLKFIKQTVRDNKLWVEKSQRNANNRTPRNICAHEINIKSHLYIIFLGFGFCFLYFLCIFFCKTNFTQLLRLHAYFKCSPKKYAKYYISPSSTSCS